MAEQLTEWLRALLLAMAGLAWSQAKTAWELFWSDPSFRRGFCTAGALGLFIALVSRPLRQWWRQVQAFFHPVPIVLYGPKPIDMYRGCVASAFKLGLVGVFIFIFLLAMLALSLQ